jgi:autotransporter translocation and assembly factor TamB
MSDDQEKGVREGPRRAEWLVAPLRVLATLVGASLALLALAATLVLAISRGWQRERVTRVVEWGVEQVFGRTLRIGALRGSLYPELEFSDVELGADSGDPEHSPALTLAHLRLELVPGALSRGELAVRLLRVAGLRVEVVSAAEKKPEQPEPTLREQIAALALPELPFPIRLQRIEIDDAAIALREADPRGPISGVGAAEPPSDTRYSIHTSLAGADLALPWTPRESERALLRARAHVVATGIAAPLPESGALDFAIELAGGRLALESIEAHTPRGSAVLESSELGLAGWLEGRGFSEIRWSVGQLRIASPELDAIARGRGTAERIAGLSIEASAPDLTKIPALAERIPGLSGSLGLRAVVSGAVAAPDVELSLEGPLALRNSAAAAIGSAQRGWFELGFATRAVYPISAMGPELRGTLALRGLELSEVRIDAIALALDTRADDYALRASALSGGREALSLDATLPRAPLGRALAARNLRGAALVRELVGDARTRLSLTLAEADSAALDRWLPPALRDRSARVTAQLKLAGARPTPALSGALALRAPALVPHTEINALKLTLSSETERYAIALRADSAIRPWLEGGVWLPRSRFETLFAAATIDAPALGRELLADSRVRAELRSAALDLSLAERWLPRELRDLGGHVRLELAAEGADPEPRYSGWIEIERASVRVPILRRVFEPVAARLEIASGVVSLQRFEVGKPGAGASASGRVLLDGLTPRSAEIALTLDHLALSRNRIARADVSGELTLSGPIDALALRGELEAEKVRVRIDSAEDPGLREIRVLAAELAPEVSDAIVEGEELGESLLTRAGDALSVDVALRVPRKTQLRGGGASLEVEGRVALRREPGSAAVLVGNASAIRGRYVFQRNRFRVRSGSVSFDGSPGVDPLIDAQAVRRVRGTQLIAHLGGRLSAPELHFTSEPPLPQDEVLALLLFGRPVSELGSGQASGVQGAAATLAAGVAFQELGGDELESILPVDSFDVGLGDEDEGASLEVGKYLGDRLFVSVGQSVGRTEGTRARAELSLTPNWSVLTDFSSEDFSGVDIEWSIEY